MGQEPNDVGPFNAPPALVALIDQRHAKGDPPNDVFDAALAWNKSSSRPLTSGAVLELIHTRRQITSSAAQSNGVEKTPPASQDVNQRDRTPGEPGNQPKASEFERKPAYAESPKPPPQEPTFSERLADGSALRLPFAEYLARSVEEHHRQEEENEEWQSPLFYFVRLVRSHPDMLTMTARQAFQAVEDVMRIWQARLPKAQRRLSVWAHWLQVEREDAEAEFLGVWDHVRYLVGRTPLEIAIDQAVAHPLGILEKHRAARPEGYARFIAIAGWLQVTMGDNRILLPVEELAERLHVTPMTISRYRRWAKEDGYLKETKSYEFHGKGKTNKATHFRFNVSLWKILTETSQTGSKESFDGA
jgi:hypothetical protein